MFPTTSSIIGSALTVASLLSAPQSVSIKTTEDAALWRPQVGDQFVVNTTTNMGYLIHPNGTYAEFEVATGQRKVVRYIGRTYNAATPNRTWVSTSKEIKGDRFTFGPSGRFLRLSYEGEGTPYGIHEYKKEDDMFALKQRYGSMGCIIVRSYMMDVMERTFVVNEGVLVVQTLAEFDPTFIPDMLVAQKKERVQSDQHSV